METGIVKSFNARKGWGFIIEENGTELFVHYSNVIMESYKKLLANDEVTFERIETAKGPAAIKVQLKGRT